jgi:Cysteine dioxygenase type I
MTLARVEATRNLTTPELLGVVRALARQRRLWLRHVRHDPQHRVFEQLRRDEHIDVWVICWNDDHDTGFHDHDISAGAVAVVEGVIVEERLAISGPHGVRVHHPGDAFSFEASHVHRMRHDPAAPPAVTIHAYSPPLWRMGTYDVARDGTLRRMSISYAEELRPAGAMHVFGGSPVAALGAEPAGAG